MNALAHTGTDSPLVEAGEYISSPLYTVLDDHKVALLAVLLLPAALWLLRRLGNRVAMAATNLEPLHRFLFWMLAMSAAVHAGLVIGHKPSGLSILFLADAALLSVAAAKLATGHRWRRFTRLVLGGSIAAFVISSVAGEPPDEVALATKLIELTALSIALMPADGSGVRRFRSSLAVVAAVLVVGISSWAGAFGASNGGHHVGEVPEPGVLLPVGEARDATDAEIAAAYDFHNHTVAGVARFADPSVAAAAGYAVDGIAGLDFHASNEAYKHDGRVLDPERPENLIYAASPDGPVLVGVMYEMEEIGIAGPVIGGPLTVWHAHNQVCFGVVPPALAGLRSPFGSCPVGSITMPVTGEMLHVFVVPGAPDRFGHLDEQWLTAYLER